MQPPDLEAVLEKPLFSEEDGRSFQYFMVGILIAIVLVLIILAWVLP